MEEIKTKKCSVILERLDEKLLKLCLLKCGLKLSSSESTNYPKVKSRQSNLKARRASNRLKQRHAKVSSRSTVKHDFERRRKKSKPLCYTDSESFSDDTNLEKKNAQIKCSTKSQLNLNAGTDFFHKSATSAKRKTNNNENFTLTLSEIGVQKLNIKRSEATITNNDVQEAEHQPVSNIIEGEIEVIKEIARPKNVNCDKMEMTSSELTVFGDDEEDSREDNEDDTSTIIFDEEFNKDTVTERSFANKDFKTREIINRKKPRLVKFKKKTMITKNVANIKSKDAEICSIWKETPAGVREEVCCLIKRLQEMHRNISRLQKEWPSHSDPVFHFQKMLNAQQESFYREIKGSRSVILKSLNIFGDFRKMILEIAKQIDSNPKDVASIISQCIYFEEPCEVNKSKSSVEKMIRQVVSQSSNNLNKMISEKNTKLLRKNVPQQTVNISCSSRPAIRLNRHPEINLTETQTCENYHQMSKRQKQLSVKQNLPVIPYAQNLITVEHVAQHGRPETAILRHLPCKPSGVQPENATQYCKVNFVVPRAIRSPQISKSNESLNFSTKVLNLTQSGFPPLKLVDRKMPNLQNQTTPAESKDAFITLSTNFSKVENQKRFPSPAKLPEELCGTKMNLTELENPASQVIDPTIPQKLTMRNYRLEAGPVLQAQVEGTNPSQPLIENKNYGLSGESSRVYVCAQKGCENPGVEICKGCQSVIYCNEFCQLKHWNLKHKAECHKLKKLRG